MTENEAVTICHLVMNTASGHFNDDLMKRASKAGGMNIDTSLVFGGVTISITIGLAHQDTGEQVIRELGMTNMKLLSPVVHGNTIYAYTEVLETESVDEPVAKSYSATTALIKTITWCSKATVRRCLESNLEGSISIRSASALKAN